MFGLKLKYNLLIGLSVVLSVGLLLIEHAEPKPECGKLAYSAASRIVEKTFHGGQDLQVSYSTCEVVNGYVVIDMDISFRGNIIRSNYYRVQGSLKVRRDGSNASFSYGRMNRTAENYIGNMEFLGVLALGTLILSN